MAEPRVQRTELESAALPLGAGLPSISEAPEVRIALNPDLGCVSVWVAGTGYLDGDERRALAKLLAEAPNG